MEQADDVSQCQLELNQSPECNPIASINAALEISHNDHHPADPKPRGRRRKRPASGTDFGELDKKPQHLPSYITLIAEALAAQPGEKATLAEIYRYLEGRDKFFTSDYDGWKNSVRHNLSMGDSFKKVDKPHKQPAGSNRSAYGQVAGVKVGKGHQWRIADNALRAKAMQSLMAVAGDGGNTNSILQCNISTAVNTHEGDEQMGGKKSRRAPKKSRARHQTSKGAPPSSGLLPSAATTGPGEVVACRNQIIETAEELANDMRGNEESRNDGGHIVASTLLPATNHLMETNASLIGETCYEQFQMEGSMLPTFERPPSSFYGGQPNFEAQMPYQSYMQDASPLSPTYSIFLSVEDGQEWTRVIPHAEPFQQTDPYGGWQFTDPASIQHAQLIMMGPHAINYRAFWELNVFQSESNQFGWPGSGSHTYNNEQWCVQ